MAGRLGCHVGVIRGQRGFTLLEVLVAIAILGLGLTVVLSAQTGVFWSYSRAAHLSRAPSLLRCKMSEVELDLLKEGYPLLDQADDGECCEGEADDRYTCSWSVQQVVLPEMPLGGMGDAGVGGPPGSLGDVGGVMGQLGELEEGSLKADKGAGTDQLTDLMSGQGSGAIASMAMGMVYPALKPMLEASIRKVTVTVHWKEGARDRELTAIQYLTSPMQGGFDADAAEGMDQLGVAGGTSASGGGGS